MRFFIDCEFNEFRGALISMALVSETGSVFYEVLPCPNPSAWVAQYVMPILGREPVSRDEFCAALQTYLARFDSAHIVADWPEDIAHFCESLITGPGIRINTPPLTMEILRVDAPSAMPHNALFDALGIRKYILAMEATPQAAEGEGNG